MKYGLYLLFTFAVVVLNIGCECVPEINTPKVINPENFSYVRLINALPNHIEISAESNDIEIQASALNDDETPQNYQKFQSGNTFVRIKSISRNQVIANHAYLLAKEERYTLAVFGRGSIAQTVLIDDVIPAPKSEIAYIRLFNLLNNANGIKFQNTAIGFDETVFFGGYTDFISIPHGKHKMNIYDTNDKLIAEVELNMNALASYDVICQGIYIEQSQNIKIRIIEIIK